MVSLHNETLSDSNNKMNNIIDNMYPSLSGGTGSQYAIYPLAIISP